VLIFHQEYKDSSYSTFDKSMIRFKSVDIFNRQDISYTDNSSKRQFLDKTSTKLVYKGIFVCKLKEELCILIMHITYR
jgi:hypothetical protein